jgi:plasmid stability protein
MPTLTIRNLPEEVHRALRLRAATHGRSVEAEVRALLAAAVAVRAGGGVAEERREFAGDAPSAIGVWGRSAAGRSEVDRLIAQRRLEAAFEGEEITAEEYARLNERVDAWEIDADWIDRFLAQRRGET